MVSTPDKFPLNESTCAEKHTMNEPGVHYEGGHLQSGKRLLLVDVDSKIPNLALMKVSARYKMEGYETGFDITNPSLIVASIVFSKNSWKADAIRSMYPGVPLLVGGSGYRLGLNLPDIVEFIRPDYDLYPSTYSQGFTTRGCGRNCHFCIVPKKEGKLVRWQHPKDFHDGRFDTIYLMDNNWLMDRGWFMETSGWIADHDLKVMEGGMDIRCVDEGVARRLSELKFKGTLKFAFDFLELKDVVQKKCAILKDCGLISHDTIFYVYTESDADFDSALERCQLLRSIGVSPFIMWDQKSRKSSRIRKLIHWANRPRLFWATEWEDYYQ
jgi:hypothetical protein